MADKRYLINWYLLLPDEGYGGKGSSNALRGGPKAGVLLRKGSLLLVFLFREAGLVSGLSS
jgi:hypothetical protein